MSEPNLDAWTDPWAEFVLTNPRFSRWLKDALASSYCRAAEDVLNDIEVLKLIVMRRLAREKGRNPRIDSPAGFA